MKRGRLDRVVDEDDDEDDESGEEGASDGFAWDEVESGSEASSLVRRGGLGRGLGDEDDEDDEDDHDDDDAEHDEETPITPPTEAALRAQHVLEGEVLGVRIQLQRMVAAAVKAQARNADAALPPTAVRQAQDVVRMLVELREALLQSQHEPLPSKETSDAVRALRKRPFDWSLHAKLEAVSTATWRRDVERWERRVRVSQLDRKELRAVDRGAFAQADAALARRRERGERTADFVTEDAEFYRTLVRSFVGSSAASSAALGREEDGGSSTPATNKRGGKSAKPAKTAAAHPKGSKGRRIQYQKVHDKLVNFMPRVVLEAPRVDEDRLVASLFAEA